MKGLFAILMERVNKYLEFWMGGLVENRDNPNVRKYAKVFLITTHIFSCNTLTILIPIFGFVISLLIHIVFSVSAMECF
jgi:hypothetical protein